MIPRDDRTLTSHEFVESIERDIQRLDRDAEIKLSTTAAMGTEANTLVFTLSDSNTERLAEAVAEVEEELNDVSVIREVHLSTEEQTPEVQIEIDEEAAREHGLAPVQIAQQINKLTQGETAAVLQTSNDDVYDIFVRLDTAFTENVDTLEDLQLTNGQGDYVALSEVAEIVEGESAATIQRLQQEQAIEFSVLYSTSSALGDVSAIINDIVADLDLDEGTTFSYGGEQEMLDDSIGNMILALVLGIVFIYLVMAAQFESFKMPFVVMFTVPLVVIGVAIALVVTQTPISIIVFIGLMVLVGIVVNNAIVILDYVNQLKAKGMATFEALVEAVRVRTRPILLTSITTILGMLPLALGIGEGADMQQPMALAVIGGLISSTFLTLFVIPVVYSLFDRETRRRYVTVDGEFTEVQEQAAGLLSEADTEKPNQTDLRQIEAAEPEQVDNEKSNDRSTERTDEGKENDASDDMSKEDILRLLEKNCRLVQK